MKIIVLTVLVSNNTLTLDNNTCIIVSVTPNVTVVEGREAVLLCSVIDSGEYLVSWIDQSSPLLTVAEQSFTVDHRLNIRRSNVTSWNLHIRNTKYSDRGQYTCQVNSNVIVSGQIMLTGLVPSKIIDETSSRDQTVHEGESFRLLCNVTGVPRPVVTWYMYRMAEENSSQSREKIGGSGEVLVIHNVSRSFDGKYECIAYNNVGPAVSREIMLSVVFAPEIVLPTKRMGQYIGRDTMLECQIAANPDAITYWKKVDTNTTFQSQEIFQISTFRVSVVLTIKDVLPEDFGEYTCYAENEFGQDQKSMFLYEFSSYTENKSTTNGPIFAEPKTDIPISPEGGEENGTASVTAIHCMAMMSILYVWSKLLL